MADPNDPSGGGEVLSQSEVDSLLAQVAGPEGTVPVVKSAAPETKDNCQRYDFRHPGFLSPGELRRLRLRHEEFIRALSARLSIYMRLEFSLQMSKLHTIPYKQFTEALPNPACLSLFKTEPLRGIGILDIHPRLGLTIVDRLLGGPAQSAASTHEFSEIEMALLDQAVQLILGEWCSHWASVQELSFTLLGHENNGQFLQTAAHDTIMLALVMDAKLGDCTEKIQIALPCSMLEPLIRKLGQATELVTESAPRTPTFSPKWNRNFDDVPVPVTALWDDLVLSAREVANLKPGDILPLDPRSARRVKLRLADRPKFQGSLGTAGGKWAVAVTEVVKGALSY
jgi:flagellar motor switch protein FliM